jgi:hypothetical protein
MSKLFIGSVDIYLAIIAKTYDQSAVLATNQNLHTFLQESNLTLYTSLADIGNISNLKTLCDWADEIFYRPPIQWNSVDEQHYTECVLIHASMHKTVDGIESIEFPYEFLNDITSGAPRVSDQLQMWAVGCSITQGVGVELHDTWRHQLSTYLKLPYTNLSLQGTSVLWQSDQICQSDIRSGDVVFWALTSHSRLPVIKQNKELFHLCSGGYQINHSLAAEFSPDLLDNDTLLYHNVMAIRRAYNFCDKQGAKLLILGVAYDHANLYQYYQVPEYQYYIDGLDGWVDHGTDNQHPGPKQHQLFVEEFKKMYRELVNGNRV